MYGMIHQDYGRQFQAKAELRKLSHLYQTLQVLSPYKCNGESIMATSMICIRFLVRRLGFLIWCPGLWSIGHVNIGITCSLLCIGNTHRCLYVTQYLIDPSTLSQQYCNMIR